MGASIFQMMGAQKNTGMLNQISQIKQMIQGKDAGAVMNLMMQRNPQFAKFAEENKCLSAEEICRKYHIDFNAVKAALGK